MAEPPRELVHALRTPLTIIEGFADLLARRGDELSPDERAEHLQRIVAAATEMRALLDAAAGSAGVGAEPERAPEAARPA